MTRHLVLAQKTVACILAEGGQYRKTQKQGKTKNFKTRKIKNTQKKRQYNKRKMRERQKNTVKMCTFSPSKRSPPKRQALVVYIGKIVRPNGSFISRTLVDSGSEERIISKELILKAELLDGTLVPMDLCS